MRTFQFSDAKSHKFWNIDISGSSFTVTYGKVGAAGQTQTKSFDSSEKAEAEADKLIREKVKKGYVETTPKKVSTQAEGFEEALAADPSDLPAPAPTPTGSPSRATRAASSSRCSSRWKTLRSLPPNGRSCRNASRNC